VLHKHKLKKIFLKNYPKKISENFFPHLSIPYVSKKKKKKKYNFIHRSEKSMITYTTIFLARKKKHKKNSKHDNPNFSLSFLMKFFESSI